MMFARPIGPDDVPKIAALGDPVLRNLWITTAYHDLGQGLAHLLGGRDISWSTFATWASKTAGLSIRKDVLTQVLNATPHGRLADRAVARFDLARLPGLSHLDLAGGVAQRYSPGPNGRFGSVHVAVQTDVTRRLFASASYLNLWQRQGMTRFPGTYPIGSHFSDYGAGWRFSRDLFVQYLFSTNYGFSTPSHTVMLRYTFRLKAE